MIEEITKSIASLDGSISDRRNHKQQVWMEVSVIEEITKSIASLDGSISARRNHKEHSKFGWKYQ